MPTHLSTHGIGAIKETGSTFTITADRGSAVVKPTEANELTGWIHFTIPSPATGGPNLNSVSIDFHSQTATVDTVAVYLANSLKFKEENLQRGQSFVLPIPSGQAIYNGKGIAVSVQVQFQDSNSKLHFQSVSIGI
ncbi:hypothetical protein FAUST_10049 [Fusarium austroamericanum]|uniref:Uncharacterized protein n=1 Tax=Fusarium austroamericanum TaxID=282268 RepID=A0AAN5Z1M1_FUSAU|nr:hypothetical protein FAUST_10049 [Fusarium austroamericanum]